MNSTWAQLAVAFSVLLYNVGIKSVPVSMNKCLQRENTERAHNIYVNSIVTNEPVFHLWLTE